MDGGSLQRRRRIFSRSPLTKESLVPLSNNIHTRCTRAAKCTTQNKTGEALFSFFQVPPPPALVDVLVSLSAFHVVADVVSDVLLLVVVVPPPSFFF